MGLDGHAVPPMMTAVEADSALAHDLQPLLEQEALLECVFPLNPIFSSFNQDFGTVADSLISFIRSFIREANAQRKFEDVKSLKMSLSEIRGEINRMTENIKS